MVRPVTRQTSACSLGVRGERKGVSVILRVCTTTSSASLLCRLYPRYTFLSQVRSKVRGLYCLDHMSSHDSPPLVARRHSIDITRFRVFHMMRVCLVSCHDKPPPSKPAWFCERSNKESSWRYAGSIFC